jgi:hypothetical protein
MITSKREQMSERLNDAADAVKTAWSDARERGADVIDAARDKVDSARDKLGSAQDSLADQLESAAAALRHNNSRGPISRMTRDRPMSAVVVAFAAGAIAAVLGGMLINAMSED